MDVSWDYSGGVHAEELERPLLYRVRSAATVTTSSGAAGEHSPADRERHEMTEQGAQAMYGPLIGSNPDGSLLPGAGGAIRHLHAAVPPGSGAFRVVIPGQRGDEAEAQAPIDMACKHAWKHVRAIVGSSRQRNARVRERERRPRTRRSTCFPTCATINPFPRGSSRRVGSWVSRELPGTDAHGST